MKKTLPVIPLLTCALIFWGMDAVMRISPPAQEKDFCATLKTFLSAAQEGFEPIKDAATTRMITGTEKNFFTTTEKFSEAENCYINDVASYPECECILERDSRITEKLNAAYESYMGQIKRCLPDGWVIIEQDSANNFYLKGTKFKKLAAREDKTGKKVKFHLYMYSSMIEKSRVVELKFEGIGK